MNQRIAAISVGVLALAGLGAVAHHNSTARASQPVAAADPATPVPGSYLDPVAPPVPGNNAVTPGAAALAAPSVDSTSPVATPVAAGAAGSRVVYRDRTVSRTRTVAARPRYYVHQRSTEHSAMIIGGSALGGAGIGALVGGKKGALIGGLVGGAAGTVYDRKTHKKVVRE